MRLNAASRHYIRRWSVQPSSASLYPPCQSCVDLGTCSASTHCEQLCRRLGSASLTAGTTVLPISSPNCTQMNLRPCWTCSSWQKPSPFGDAHPTSDLTRNVDCQAKRTVRRLERSACLCRTHESTGDWYSKRCEYRALLRRKREQFWRMKIDAERSTPRELWHSVPASLYCVSYEVSTGPFPGLFSSRW